MAKQVQPKPVKVTRVNRSQAATKVILGLEKGAETTSNELAEKADAMFVEHGGESKIKAAEYYIKRVLEVLEAAGTVKCVRPTDTLVTRVK